jgi:hypothetical protein
MKSEVNVFCIRFSLESLASPKEECEEKDPRTKCCWNGVADINGCLRKIIVYFIV